jgi:hypothetical protein
MQADRLHCATAACASAKRDAKGLMSCHLLRAALLFPFPCEIRLLFRLPPGEEGVPMLHLCEARNESETSKR